MLKVTILRISVLIMVLLVIGYFTSELDITTAGLLVGPLVSLKNNVKGVVPAKSIRTLLFTIVYRTVQDQGIKQPYLAIYDYSNMALLDLVSITTSTGQLSKNNRISVLSHVIDFLNSLTGVNTVHVVVLKSDIILSSVSFKNALLLLDLVDTVEIIPRNDSIRSSIANLRLLINSFPLLPNTGAIDLNRVINHLHGTSSSAIPATTSLVSSPSEVKTPFVSTLPELSKLLMLIVVTDN